MVRVDYLIEVEHNSVIIIITTDIVLLCDDGQVFVVDFA